MSTSEQAATGVRPAPGSPGDDSPGLAARVRAFVAEHVEPAEDALDAPGADRRPLLAALNERARNAGLWALPLPRGLGGGGLSLTEYAPVAVEEGRSDHGPAALGSAGLLDVRMLDRHGSPQLRHRYLADLAAGRVRACYAMTEPGVRGTRPAEIGTRAVADSGGWVLDGRKWFITGAAEADLVTVLARVVGPAGADGGLTMFCLPADLPGVRVERELPMLGAGGQYEIALDGVRAGAEHVLGTPGEGLAIASERVALGRTLRCLRWTGQAERAYGLLLARAADTGRGGPPLGDHQLVRRLVFEAHLAIAGTRPLVDAAVREVAAGGDARQAVALAKVAAARMLSTVTDAAVQVYGAEGLGPDTPLPRLLRVARQARILDGPDESHIASFAGRLLRQYAATGSAPPAAVR
ncbi:acyl-CoA dehydrogenase family protein [Streptomonospora nanhaiensis]|uniref:Alkylation response protein AidB-like acyl-CoA dehydrogenase n=1 Tax=Streptomonospora nanhaiensis TaxID=1323731 RepID=A0A853BTX5_9ACTN|nr:acyl-CoA dehydrogenase family protein [Streptomonospora nanhaiensis]MBV2367231.1 acyl-CoA dehydrogenase family protein [Streptomonospora nanhaiensis]MBX9391702.1 acyl-CoA dehydrogenase family protein [Streptomonospora nanhaiensis]NYI98185.1 alkylation response protein AidB-like acyl-CoA dehydrogenase [Streptomonospora nanhaiensis]